MWNRALLKGISARERLALEVLSQTSSAICSAVLFRRLLQHRIKKNTKTYQERYDYGIRRLRRYLYGGIVTNNISISLLKLKKTMVKNDGEN